MIEDRIKVLAVADSALMRSLMGHMLAASDMIDLIGTAPTGSETLDKIKRLRPNVVIVDFETFEQGLDQLQLIMSAAPVAVIVLCHANQQGLAYEALRCGAENFISRPTGPVVDSFNAVKGEVIRKIQAAHCAEHHSIESARAPHPSPNNETEREIRPFTKVVAIGSSTGGPQALESIFHRLSADFPAPILVVQHLPHGFSEILAARLSKLGPLAVKEAVDGDSVRAGEALVAPGGSHMVVVRRADGDYAVRLDESAPHNSLRPSVDKLMFSVAQACGEHSVGVILSGMGTDGMAGMHEIKQAGGRTIVQNEETSVVFGMPGAAVERGLADHIVPIDQVAPTMLDVVRFSGR